MQVILMERISNLGQLGDEVSVKSGYGRNYLIPKGKAVFATPANIERFEARRHELEQKAAERLANAEKRAEQIKTLVLTHSAKASDEGKLFGSVGVRDIADIITRAGVEVAKSEVCMPDGPIRSTGEFNIEIQLHSDVLQPVKITILPE